MVEGIEWLTWQHSEQVDLAVVEVPDEPVAVPGLVKLLQTEQEERVVAAPLQGLRQFHEADHLQRHGLCRKLGDVRLDQRDVTLEATHLAHNRIESLKEETAYSEEGGLTRSTATRVSPQSALKNSNF